MSPKIHDHLESPNMTLFCRCKLKFLRQEHAGFRVGSKSNDCFAYKRKEREISNHRHEYTEGKLCEDRRSNWSDAFISYTMSRIARVRGKEERHGIASPSDSPEGITVNTLISNSSDLLKGEVINLSCFKPPNLC